MPHLGVTMKEFEFENLVFLVYCYPRSLPQCFHIYHLEYFLLWLHKNAFEDVLHLLKNILILVHKHYIVDDSSGIKPQMLAI